MLSKKIEYVITNQVDVLGCHRFGCWYEEYSLLLISQGLRDLDGLITYLNAVIYASFMLLGH